MLTQVHHSSYRPDSCTPGAARRDLRQSRPSILFRKVFRSFYRLIGCQRRVSKRFIFPPFSHSLERFILRYFYNLYDH